MSGLIADSRTLIDKARVEAQVYETQCTNINDGGTPFILLQHLFYCRSGFMCNQCCNLFYCSIYLILLHMKPHL